MVTLKIIKEKEYNRYNLVDESTTKYYSVVLEFYNMKKPELNSYLQIDERLLDENYEDYCQPYAFEPTLEKDYCAVLVDEENNKTFLRRIYG